MSAKLIIDALYTKLTASTGTGTFYEAVGGRIYHSLASDKADMPLCVYNVITNEVIKDFGGIVTQRMLVQFDLYGERRLGGAAVLTIEALLYTLLDSFALTISGYDRGLCLWQSRGVPSIEEDSWRVMNEMVITATDF